MHVHVDGHLHVHPIHILKPLGKIACAVLDNGYLNAIFTTLHHYPKGFDRQEKTRQDLFYSAQFYRTFRLKYIDN